MPDYNDRAKLDPTQVTDARGRSSMGGPIAIGGGGLGILFLIISVLLGANPLELTGVSPTDSTGGGTSNLAQECQTGADARRREDCRAVLFVNSIQDFWTQDYAGKGQRYRPAQTQIFAQATNTACGSATSDVGPFYCPRDTTVYLDLTFFQELQSRFGASGGDFAMAYVIAHEYGHHIQNLTGDLGEAQTGRTGAESGAVRVELQADCLAGVWARNATATGYINSLSEKDITDALSAAASVGDDRIQKASTGRVNPEKWTHGSSDQRVKWFSTGYRSGDSRTCDTFSGGI